MKKIAVFADVQNLYYTVRQAYGCHFNYAALWADISKQGQIVHLLHAKGHHRDSQGMCRLAQAAQEFLQHLAKIAVESATEAKRKTIMDEDIDAGAARVKESSSGGGGANESGKKLSRKRALCFRIVD